ncbi:MAG: hypothetical protein R3320_09460 [Nitriliruptorales bacterium]|nr:hypothetical protein [Nitriliruptorales bacterium]
MTLNFYEPSPELARRTRTCELRRFFRRTSRDRDARGHDHDQD